MENAGKGRMEGILADLGRKIDQLIAKANDASGDARGEFSSKMEELNKCKEKAEQELREFANDEEKWKEVQSRLQLAADELKKAFELTFQKRSGEKS